MKHNMNLLHQLYGDPNVSKCCKYKYFVQYGSEGTSYWVCKKCSNPCETVPKDLKDL